MYENCIYIYHHVWGEPSIEHKVEEYNHFCYLKPVPEVIDMVNTIGSSKSLYDDKDCRSIGSSDFNKNEAKNNICDTIIS